MEASPTTDRHNRGAQPNRACPAAFAGFAKGRPKLTSMMVVRVQCGPGVLEQPSQQGLLGGNAGAGQGRRRLLTGPFLVVFDMRLRKPLDSCAECCCVQSGGDSQGHYSQYAQVPDVEKGGGAAKKKAPVKKKANLPPKKKGGPPGRKSVQEESEVRCFLRSSSHTKAAFWFW